MNNRKIKIGSNKSFGFVFTILFTIIGLWPLYNDEIINTTFIYLAFILFLITIIKSDYLSLFNKIWFKFGLLLGGLISPIVMAVIFFLIITPISLILKIIGKDVLNIKKNNNKSYWIIKSNLKSKMKNQF
tara:strand:- start:3155 stop:3544 length:390 start_codon:yes stop_codon:yes gene_type:complete